MFALIAEENKKMSRKRRMRRMRRRDIRRRMRRREMPEREIGIDVMKEAEERKRRRPM